MDKDKIISDFNDYCIWDCNTKSKLVKYHNLTELRVRCEECRLYKFMIDKVDSLV